MSSAYTHALRRIRRRTTLAAVTVLASIASVASADMVTDWTTVATTAIVAGGPRAGAVDFAIVHGAIYDAVNAIDGSYETYKVDPVAPTRGASREAATAAAAYQTLKGIFPAQASMLDAAYASSLATIPDSVSKTRGIAVGEEVAARTLELRSNDGRNAVAPPYVFGTGPGVYQQTIPFPPTGPVNTWLPGVTPMVLLSPWQFRAYGPPGLTSERFTRDLAETQAYGSATSTVRTETQSEIARFHTENPNQFWGRNLGNFVASRNLGITRSARLMALLAFADADASIACFDSKYTYSFWRPVTAIQQTDPSWTSYMNTPPHPEYPAAHGCVAGAVAETMKRYFGTPHIRFQFNSTVTGMTHYYRDPQDLVEEVTNARIYGGMHYRNSVEHGVLMGKQVAKWVSKHALQPRHPGHK